MGGVCLCVCFFSESVLLSTEFVVLFSESAFLSSEFVSPLQPLPCVCLFVCVFCFYAFSIQVPLRKLFSYADSNDKLFMFIGTLAACIHAW